MSSESRFTAQNKTTQQRISSNTVGLVALSDFRKRRAEVLEQQEREAREAANSGSAATGTPNRSATGTPDPSGGDASKARKTKKKKLNKVGGAKLSFGADDEEEEGGDSESGLTLGKPGRNAAGKVKSPVDTSIPEEEPNDGEGPSKSKFKVNNSISVVPRSLTKSALRREAAEREVLRQEFLARQEAVKATEIAIPFVFYEGTNIRGGTVRVKKGDFVWVFLDKSRKVGANRGVGEKIRAMREWARVGVDDLMMVRGNVIIPPHYEFLYFIMNKTMGSNGEPLFNYSTEAPTKPAGADVDTKSEPADEVPAGGLSRGGKAGLANLPDMSTLEGASDDPSITKVVDKRWYDKNKHIYPASLWQDFDPEKEEYSEVRRDLGGNAFFYS